MAVTRPEASETTGTLRATSGVTAPVTTNSEVVERLTAAASGNCSGWSTAKSVMSTSGVTLAGGGASAAWSARAPWQAASVNADVIATTRHPISRFLLFISELDTLQAAHLFQSKARRIRTA